MNRPLQEGVRVSVSEIRSENSVGEEMNNEVSNASDSCGDIEKETSDNYVIDANPNPSQDAESGVTLKGGKCGRNILLGTQQADNIEGGENDDILVGRGGADTLKGNDGNDNFLPWGLIEEPTNTASSINIDGGEGLDRVYIKGTSTSFPREICEDSQCSIKIKGQDGEVRLNNVEVIIFDDTAILLN